MLKYYLQLLLPAQVPGVRSLRSQLLTLSLLAVLTGSGVLVVAHSLLSANARRLRHLQAVERVRLELLAAQINSRKGEGLQDHLRRLLTPGMVVWMTGQSQRPQAMPRTAAGFAVPIPLPELLKQAEAHMGKAGPQEFRVGQLNYVSSGLTVPVLSPRGKVRLGFLSDVTEDQGQEQVVQNLLAASALVTTLLTGLLLRPAISSGLQPLGELSSRLERIQTETLAQQQIQLEDQPVELLPIAEAFNRLLQRLAEAWERQRTFVNGVSHELRTPITIIGGYARRLARDAEALTPRQRQQLGLIVTEAERMGQLVTDLLDLARSDAGHLQLNPSGVDPCATLQAVLSRLQEHAEGRLEVDPALLHCQLPRAGGDPTRVEQCLANLVENALKYAPAATPVRLSGSSQPNGTVVLNVIDQGPGVPVQDRQLIFERFRRGSQATDVVGSGIGLAVVQALMRAMGGDVDVVDAEGGGANFRLQLPPATDPSAGAEAEARKS
ncbi:MAG: sensor histidine kinase [Synechococcaceae cyanobacterium]